MIVVVLVAAVAVIVVGALVRSYNRFVGQRQLIENSWANVDTELQRRHQLVPNLVATVKGYSTHEQTTLDAVIRARRDAVDRGDAGAENVLGRSIRRLLALAEAYPDLRASEHFLELQHELTRTEDRLQAARRIFNGNVRDYNQRIDAFPSTVVAKMFGFERARYYELDDVVTIAPRPTARF